LYENLSNRSMLVLRRKQAQQLKDWNLFKTKYNLYNNT